MYFNVNLDKIREFTQVIYFRGYRTDDFEKSARVNISTPDRKYVVGLTLIQKKNFRIQYYIIISITEIKIDKMNKLLSHLKENKINWEKNEFIKGKEGGYLICVGLKEQKLEELIKYIWNFCFDYKDSNCNINLERFNPYIKKIDHSSLNLKEINIPVKNYHWLIDKFRTKKNKEKYGLN
jgi:hypothetical protein